MQYQKPYENLHPANPAKHMLFFAYIPRSNRPEKDTSPCQAPQAAIKAPNVVAAGREARTESMYASDSSARNADPARRGQRLRADKCLDARARFHGSGIARETLKCK